MSKITVALQLYEEVLEGWFCPLFRKQKTFFILIIKSGTKVCENGKAVRAQTVCKLINFLMKHFRLNLGNFNVHFGAFITVFSIDFSMTIQISSTD